MILTGFAFLNIKMLELFNSPEYRILVDYIRHFQNGEDILMNFIVAANFKAPPIRGDFMQINPEQTQDYKEEFIHKRHMLCFRKA